MQELDRIKVMLKNSVSIPKERQTMFFKTKPGDYAEHDRFIGVTVPTLRKIAKNFDDLSLENLQSLLESRVNEERFLALIILVSQYEASSHKEILYEFYLNNLKHVNNWNLVDSSAHLIIGAHLMDADRRFLLTLAESNILWERRVAIVSTWAFIKNKDLEWTFKIAFMLLGDAHDLIHKAVGWMLREAGKQDQNQLITFLDEHVKVMPRTMLRYAIEKFPEKERKLYLVNPLRRNF